jgi:hypothetical protein
MATFNELLEHTAKLRGQILDDIAACRAGDLRLIRNNEDVTEKWVRDQETRADKLAGVLAANEKPPVYLYGAF